MPETHAGDPQSKMPASKLLKKRIGSCPIVAGSTRKELRQLDCSYFYPRTSAGGISTGSPVPQVLATTQGDPANLDPSSRHYDSDSELRCQMSNSILMSHLKNPMQREMAERFFK